MEQTALVRCIGCSAMVCDVDGPTHPYIGASPGCWSVYGEVLSREYGAYGYPECHRLTVDTYAAQHPGVESRQSIQSVAVHLISMMLIIEDGVRAAHATRMIRALVPEAPRFVWLEPPSFEGTMSVQDVAVANTLAAHQTQVKRWAESVWAAWRAHHSIIRQWSRAKG